MGKALAAFLLVAAATSAATPQEVVKAAVTGVITVLEDKDLARPANADKRRADLRRVADGLFDFTEMARRSLGRHWNDRTPREREEFVRLFTELLERSYAGKFESYSGEKVVIYGESIDGDYAAVRTKIVTPRKLEIPVEYRLYRVGQTWAAYDVLFEGVSFVATYRSQFNRIVQTTSFDQLLARMKQKEVEVVTIERRAGGN